MVTYHTYSYMKAWREKNKERLKEYRRKYYLLHKDKERENNLKWRSQHKDRQREWMRKYAKEQYHSNLAFKQKVLQRKKKYYHLNKEEIRMAIRKEYQKVRAELLVLLGNKCVKCGYSNQKALCFDHIYGNGKEDRKRFNRNNFRLMKYYLEHPEEAKQKLQILCANCNMIKAYDMGECRKSLKWNGT